MDIVINKSEESTSCIYFESLKGFCFLRFFFFLFLQNSLISRKYSSVNLIRTLEFFMEYVFFCKARIKLKVSSYVHSFPLLYGCCNKG